MDREAKRAYDRALYAAMDADQKAAIIKKRQDYYAANKERVLARTRDWTLKRLAKHRQIVMDAKSQPCMDCGVQYPFWVMDFDHRPDEQKRANINQLMRNWKVSEASLREEMAKCDLVCANCHRTRTYERMVASNDDEGEDHDAA